MRISLFALPLILVLSSAVPSFAADKTIPDCDFNGDGVTDTAVLVRNRYVLSDLFRGGKVNLDGKYTNVACADTDGDGKDEITATVLGRTFTYSPILATATTNRAFSKVCKNVRGLLRGEIYKSIASHHISPGDPRAASTSFITLRSTTPPRSSCLSGYDKKGNLIHKLGQYYPTGVAYSSRFYGGAGCGDRKSPRTIAAIAKKNTGSVEMYLTSGTGNCAKVPDPTKCYNSSGC